MNTSKTIIRRTADVQDLKHIGLCYLLVTLLIVGSFGLSSLSFMAESSRNANDTPVVTVGNGLEMF
ncbi:MAG: hypothetical protein ACI8V2_004566 [Candidatus Latescibacterota bacterium]|jgi:hypothetical protein